MFRPRRSRPLHDLCRAIMLAGVVAAPVAAQPDGAWDAVGRLNVAGYNTRQMCSATLIAPDLVLTAAHCVADPRDGRSRNIGDMVFVAGWDGAGHAGAGRVAALDIHPRAFSGGQLDIAHDLALVILREPLDIPPLAVGTAGAAGPFTMAGYTRSRPYRITVTRGCDSATLGALWRLGCQAEPGQSGGPVLFGTGGARRVVAVVIGRRPGAALVVPVDGWLRRAIAQRR